MKHFKLNFISKRAMARERARLEKTQANNFTTEIDRHAESYWISAEDIPAADASLKDTLSDFAATIAGLK